MELLRGPLSAIVVLGFLAAVIYGFVCLVRWIRAAPYRFQPQVHDTPPDTGWRSRPSPGQIWWAVVPYADGTGGKVRPCLVIRTHGRGVEVLKITSQDKSHRKNYISIPTTRWDPRAQKDSWLDLAASQFIYDHAFRRRAGNCDDETWSRVARHHRTGWVYDPNLHR